MDAREALITLDAAQLARLSFHPDDADVVLTWRDEIVQHDTDLTRIQQIANGLRAGIGRWFDVWDDPTPYSPDDDQHRLGRGVLPLFGLLTALPDVRAAHAARAIPDDISWASLGDLGLQVAKDHRVNGSTGLHNHGWLRNAWADGFARLGRLQFELSRSHLGHLDTEVPVLSVHIPADGALAPSDVDASFAQAGPYFARHYPEVDGLELFVCHSWLLDPTLSELLPGSNLAAFQQRWQRWTCEVSDRDGYYFGFDIEPEKNRDLPYGLDDLPYDTRLHRALIDFWRDGGHIRSCRGMITIT